MKASYRKGFSFGITTAVIATLGVIVGIHAGTDLRHAVIAAILIIAFVDSMADALGVYLSEKARGDIPGKEVWASSVAAFFGKLFFALTFIIPILLFSLHTAIIICIIYGLLVLGIYSFYTARARKDNITQAIVFHVLAVVIAIVFSQFIGSLVNSLFR